MLNDAERLAKANNDLWSAAQYCRVSASLMCGKGRFEEGMQAIDRAIEYQPEEASFYEVAGNLSLTQDPVRALQYCMKGSTLGNRTCRVLVDYLRSIAG